jgi:predicted flap endonuclease-1-like 5' DNA nuclease
MAENTIRRNGRASSVIPVVEEAKREESDGLAAGVDEGGLVEADELAQIPRLGPVRRRALADAGISTLDALRALSFDELARIKYVGAGNARLIKTWLEQQDAAPTPEVPALSVTETGGSDAPPPPPALEIPAVVSFEAESYHVSELANLDTAIPNQTAYDDLEQIDTAITNIKGAIPKKSRHPKLKKQLDKVSTSISEVPENLDALTPQERVDAARALDRIAKLLEDAVEGGKLSAKKQETVGTKLRKLRKRLDRVVGG